VVTTHQRIEPGVWNAYSRYFPVLSPFSLDVCEYGCIVD
jgi:hypothetical protein